METQEIKVQIDYLFGLTSQKMFCKAIVVDDYNYIKSGDIVAFDFWGKGEDYRCYEAHVGIISGVHVYGVYRNPMFGKFLKVVSTDDDRINNYLKNL